MFFSLTIGYIQELNFAYVLWDNRVMTRGFSQFNLPSLSFKDEEGKNQRGQASGARF